MVPFKRSTVSFARIDEPLFWYISIPEVQRLRFARLLGINLRADTTSGADLNPAPPSRMPFPGLWKGLQGTRGGRDIQSADEIAGPPWPLQAAKQRSPGNGR